MFIAPTGELPPDVLAAWRDGLRQGSLEAALTASPEWFRLMSGGRADSSTCAVLRDDGGTCVAILPLLRQVMSLDYSIAGLRLGGRSLQVLRVCGGDLIEAGVKPDALSELWMSLFIQYPEIDAVWMDHVGDGRRRQLVAESTSACGTCFPVIRVARQPHHYACLGAGRMPLERSKSTQRRLMRYERALAAHQGPVVYSELRSAEQLLARSPEIEALMNSAWQAEWLGMGTDVKAQLPVARAGLLRSWLLEAGGKPVAFLLGYQGNGVVCLHQIGYAQSAAPFSPGTLLLNHVMALLAAEKEPLTVDFGSGEAGYKQHYTNETGWSSRIMIVRKTPRLRLMTGLHQIVSALDRGLRLLAKKLRLRDWLVRKLKRG